MVIQQTVTFKTTAEGLYKALMSSEKFSAATGAAAEIEDNEGGRFSCFGGRITGRHVELKPNMRIVQAWHASPWDESDYSIVRFDISESGDSTTLTLEHSGFPDGGEKHLESGWHTMYWEPLQSYFS